jgi:hypothetical protein
MDAPALRGLYAEHVVHAGATADFSPPNNPSLVCIPERELWYVVGEAGIDMEKWELTPRGR